MKYIIGFDSSELRRYRAINKKIKEISIKDIDPESILYTCNDSATKIISNLTGIKACNEKSITIKNEDIIYMVQFFSRKRAMLPKDITTLPEDFSITVYEIL